MYLPGGTGISRVRWIPFVALGVLVLALPLASQAAAADGTTDLDGGDGQTQVFVTVQSAFDLAENGHPIPMEVVVTDVHGLPQGSVPVVLSASTGTVSPDRVVTDATGKASFTFSADVPEDTVVRITGRTELQDAAQGIDAFVVRVIRLPPPPIYAQAQIVSLGILSGLVAFVSSTEPGRHAILGLFYPLYTRIKREEILDHFVRGQVFGTIRTEPGVHFTAIRDTLGLSNGGLSYHLRTLEVAGFIRSARDGLYKRFYPSEGKETASDQGIRLSGLQKRLLDLLRRHPATPQRELARSVDVTQQSVSYNLRILQELGLVESLGGRRHRRYLVAEP